ncbi:LacI family DNA-binding transcriptional regulator [Nostocoides sp. Soil756]|uniref:LacI family DNA-binding transcriptional regulator n=1 Tax=Nostocoides sp. Soil756 TaxID=1736399 RepID=UPI00070184E9|nr:LacI family DNA-binding transcriptional regulator [Tetrasphaera sp. Soil756]KRE62785.1 hypothetical protein ASG78_07325 [Tetrasphaera sp. Soil756]
MARLKDVAEAAGVSVRTVSNVVNNYAYVHPDTRSRVQAAIEEMGYRPNLAARNLRRGRTGMIGLAVPDLTVPYFAELAQHVLKAVAASGLTLLIEQTDGELDREIAFACTPQANALDGLLLSPLSARASDLTPDRASIPIVLLGERIFDSPFDHVAIDNVAAARAATLHLANLGRERVAAIGVGTDIDSPMADLRQRGYGMAVEEGGLSRDPRLVAPTTSFSRAEGYRAATVLLDSGADADALFCFNDLLAQGALRALSERGIAVPGAVAVIGMDDNDEDQYLTPSLSSISPDKEDLARRAVARLLARINGDRTSLGVEERPRFTLVARESAP